MAQLSEKGALRVTLAMLFCIVGVSSFCEDTAKFPRNGCSFNYKFTDANCSLFQLVQCSYSACKAYSLSTPHTCIEFHTKTSPDWTACTATCCDPSQTNYPYEYSSLALCQGSATPNPASDMIQVIGSVIGGIGATLIIVLFCCCRESIYTRCPSIENCC
jgi:hypothetical protein